MNGFQLSNEVNAKYFPVSKLPFYLAPVSPAAPAPPGRVTLLLAGLG